MRRDSSGSCKSKETIKRTNFNAGSLGEVSQLENGLVVAVRNAVLKGLPASLMQKQAQAIDEFPNLTRQCFCACRKEKASNSYRKLLDAFGLHIIYIVDDRLATRKSRLFPVIHPLLLAPLYLPHS